MVQFSLTLWCGKDESQISELYIAISQPHRLSVHDGIEKWHCSASFKAADQKSTLPIDSLKGGFDVLVSAIKLLRETIRNYLSLRSFKLYERRGGGRYREVTLESIFATNDYQITQSTIPKNNAPIKAPVSELPTYMKLKSCVEHFNQDPLKQFLPGISGLKVPQPLQDLWQAMGGETTTGLIKPGYQFLTVDEVLRKRNSLFVKANTSWLKDLYPIFAAPNNYFICYKSSDQCIYALNLMWEDVYKIAGSLDDYLQFLFKANMSKIYQASKIHDQDPVKLLDAELEVCEALQNSRIYPLVQDPSTVLDWVFSH